MARKFKFIKKILDYYGSGKHKYLYKKPRKAKKIAARLSEKHRATGKKLLSEAQKAEQRGERIGARAKKVFAEGTREQRARRAAVGIEMTFAAGRKGEKAERLKRAAKRAFDRARRERRFATSK